MIVEALIALLTGLLTSAAGLFGSLSMPDWWSDVDVMLSDLAVHAAGFGQWVPVSEAVTALGFLVGCFALALTIKLVRIVVSLFTAGGGSAA